jgi:malonyl-CoA O-methyltransferase
MVVQRIMGACLQQILQHGEDPEPAFRAALDDMPARLREWADQLESPTDDLERRPEPSALDGYAMWAESYDREAGNPVIAGEEEVIWRLIDASLSREALEKGALDVLDVGCGTGRHALPLAARGAHVVAVDPAPEMLAQARRRAEEAGLKVDFGGSTIENLDPALGFYDLVLCCLVLSHVEDLNATVAALAAHVRPGGTLIVSDFHPLNILLGWRTSCSFECQKYVVPNYLHLPADYCAAVCGSGLSVTGLFETGRTTSLPGLPMVLVIEARRGQ